MIWSVPSEKRQEGSPCTGVLMCECISVCVRAHVRVAGCTTPCQLQSKQSSYGAIKPCLQLKHSAFQTDFVHTEVFVFV